MGDRAGSCGGASCASTQARQAEEASAVTLGWAPEVGLDFGSTTRMGMGWPGFRFDETCRVFNLPREGGDAVWSRGGAGVLYLLGVAVLATPRRRAVIADAVESNLSPLLSEQSGPEKLLQELEEPHVQEEIEELIKREERECGVVVQPSAQQKPPKITLSEPDEVWRSDTHQRQLLPLQLQTVPCLVDARQMKDLMIGEAQLKEP